MKKLLWLLKWMLKAAIFFTLFAAPLVLVVLAAFTAGVAIGVLGMVPRWWKHRKAAQRSPLQMTGQPSAQPTATHPAEHGL